MKSADAMHKAYHNIRTLKIPLPDDAMPELVEHTGVDDPRTWVQMGDNVMLRPLLFNVAQGSWVNLLRAKGTGVVSRHRHPAPVTGYTMDGAWGYMEHEWVAEAGTFIYEPAGETHTLVVHPDPGHMTVLFHNFGPLIFVDEAGKQVGYQDVFTRIQLYREAYAKNGLGADFVDHLIR